MVLGFAIISQTKTDQHDVLFKQNPQGFFVIQHRHNLQPVSEMIYLPTLGEKAQADFEALTETKDS